MRFGLFTEGADPLMVALVNARHDVVLLPFELFLSKLEAPLEFDLLHAAVLGLSVNVVCWNEDSLVRTVLLEGRVANWVFRLPVV